MKKLLFVCGRNEQRSPSFEIWFKEYKPEYEVMSAGITKALPGEINRDMLNWADMVFLMDLEQEIFIKREFPEFISKCEIIGCSDQYPRASEQLNRVIKFWVNKRGL